jgi:hypothetical protein
MRVSATSACPRSADAAEPAPSPHRSMTATLFLIRAHIRDLDAAAGAARRARQLARQGSGVGEPDVAACADDFDHHWCVCSRRRGRKSPRFTPRGQVYVDGVGKTNPRRATILRGPSRHPASSSLRPCRGVGLALPPVTNNRARPCRQAPSTILNTGVTARQRCARSRPTRAILLWIADDYDKLGDRAAGRAGDEAPPEA